MPGMWFCAKCFKDIMGDIIDGWDKTTGKSYCDACKKKEKIQ